MYAFIIIETENEIQARIARIFLEADGYPSIAATVEVLGERHSACFTAAPEGVPQQFERVIKEYALLGERGVKLAEQVCAEPMVKLLAMANPRQVPAELLDTVRNSLLHTLYTAAEEEDSKVVFCEPAYSSAVQTHVTDAPTAPVKNPDGGGFDGPCRGADRWRDHDPGDEHPRPHFSA